MLQATPSSNLLLKCWGDEAVVFNVASGDTHYLKPLTFALYQTCREHPGFTAEQLAATLAQRLKMADTPQFHDLADEVFGQLHQIGLLQSP